MKKKKIYRLIALSVLLVVFTAASTAQGFGTIPFEQEKRISGMETQFSLGLINLDDVTREVRFSVENSTNYEVRFEENPVNLDPSEVTSNPLQDIQWYSIGDGRYAEVREVSFNVSVKSDSDSRNLSIPVQVNAVYGNGENSDTSQTAIQSRVHRYQLVTTSQKVDPNQEDFFNDGSLLNTTENTVSNEENVNSSNLSNKESSNFSDSENTSEPEKGLTEQSKEGNEAVNKWTIMFLLGTLISVVVITRELL